MPSQTSDNDTLGMLWGAEAIGAYANIYRPGTTEVDVRKAYHLLETGKLDADKCGQTWISTKARLRRQFDTPTTLTSTNTVEATPVRTPRRRQARR